MIKKIIITVALTLISVVFIFSGVILQKNHSEKYVQTKATLVYEKARAKLPSILTYSYKANDRTYTINKTGGMSFSERTVSYNKVLPSDYHFGYIAPVTKVLLFIGILFAMIALYALFKVILDLSFADKMLPCIFLYYVAGIAVLTELAFITLLIALITLVIIAVCLTAKKNSEDYY